MPDKLCSVLKSNARTLFLSGDIHENKFTEHDGFYEVTSSGVGRDNLNNYGLIEFKEAQVEVKLRGRKSKDNRDVVIDADSWEWIKQVNSSSND